jgi:hypothetical protein
MCSSGHRRALALLVGLVALGAAPAAAWAQACCAAAGLVIPARLRPAEDFGAGAQVRERSIFGSFAANGSFATQPMGDMDTEQDLFAAARVFRRGQLAVLVPFIETRRSEPGVTGWGGGIGDVVVNARYDLLLPREGGPHVPAIAILAGVLFPTGRAPDEVSDPNDATGRGTFEGSVGLEVEQVWRHMFVTADGWIGQRTHRVTASVAESFAPRFTALLAGGYAFDWGMSVGAFATANHQGDNYDLMRGQTLSDSSITQITAGLAAALPLADVWRVQGTASTDWPISGLGRNQLAGAGLSLSLLRIWM